MSDFSLFGGRNWGKKAGRNETSKNAPLEKAACEASKPMSASNTANAEAVDPEILSLEELPSSLPFAPQDSTEGAVQICSEIESTASKAPDSAAPVSQPDRRSKHRALISAPVRVRSTDLTKVGLDEITTTLNVSRMGILLETSNTWYSRSIDVMVTFPYSNAPMGMQPEQAGRVVRINELASGRRAVAIALGVTHQEEEFINSGGEKVQAQRPPQFIVDRDPNSPRPLVVALDAEDGARESMKGYLMNEGYDVITVRNAQEAREVLSQCTPSLVIAEIEGDGMPGYDICAHCKSTPRLQGVPVMLMTTSAYPSDYASAHSLGAVVCMAKPYRQERLGHVVRLLAPPPNANDNAMPPRPADMTRRPLGNGNHISKAASNSNRRFRLGRKQ
ncbi:MAG: response regulator [Candidatus Acidiferrales bacterium]